MSADSDLKEIETWVIEAGEHSNRAVRDLVVKLRAKFGLECASIEAPAEVVDDVADDSAGGGEDEGIDFESMKVPELRVYAAEQGIDLDGITKKNEIIEAIEAATSEAEDDESEVED